MSSEGVPPTAVVIEDDELVRRLLADLFEAAGFRAIQAEGGAAGIAAVTEHEPVITTVDINMPGIDGIETTRRIRSRSGTHIIVVSALTDEADAVLALASGADDFVAKPFRVREFRARIEAALRRARPGSLGSASPAPDVAATRQPRAHLDVTVDLATRIADRGGVDLELTRTEFEVFTALLESGRRVRTREELVRASRSSRHDATEVTEVEMRTIESHIAKLRRKLGEDPAAPRYIETVRGVGYRLTAAEAE